MIKKKDNHLLALLFSSALFLKIKTEKTTAWKKKISKMQEEMQLYQTKIDSVDEEMEAARQKIESTRDKFENTYHSIKEIMENDITKIESIL